MKFNKNMIAIVVVLVLLVLAVFLFMPKANAPKLSADGVDYIPVMGYSECMASIQQTNPNMSDSDAQDNCIAVDAINANDASKCEGIANAQIKQSCYDNI